MAKKKDQTRRKMLGVCPDTSSDLEIKGRMRYKPPPLLMRLIFSSFRQRFLARH